MRLMQLWLVHFFLKSCLLSCCLLRMALERQGNQGMFLGVIWPLVSSTFVESLLCVRHPCALKCKYVLVYTEYKELAGFSPQHGWQAL